MPTASRSGRASKDDPAAGVVEVPRVLISVGNSQLLKHVAFGVGVLAKFYFQPAPEISKRKFHLVLPVTFCSLILGKSVYYNRK